MEQSRESTMKTDDLPGTLPGLGPRVEIEELEIQLQPHFTETIHQLGEDWFLAMMRAQQERYEWFVERIDKTQRIEAHIQALIHGGRGPGTTELALASLSLSERTMARAVLNAWQPPEHDLELALFHQICLAEAFRE